jgi:hypothetical protein
MSITIEKEKDYFPPLYYSVLVMFPQGNSDEDFFHAIYMLKYKGKRNNFLERLQAICVAIISLIHNLDCSLEIGTETSRVECNRLLFQSAESRSACHFVRQNYSKREVFLNLRTSILPIKNNCLKIPLKSFLIPLTKPFALNVEM